MHATFLFIQNNSFIHQNQIDSYYFIFIYHKLFLLVNFLSRQDKLPTPLHHCITPPASHPDKVRVVAHQPLVS
jgi:hypothetical protein